MIPVNYEHEARRLLEHQKALLAAFEEAVAQANAQLPKPLAQVWEDARMLAWTTLGPV
jgi:hypothetical protein